MSEQPPAPQPRRRRTRRRTAATGEPRQAPWWWPMVIQVFGMAIIVEQIITGIDSYAVLSIGCTLAVSGSVLRTIRSIAGGEASSRH